MNKYNAAALDMDGTLIDSLKDLAVAGNTALEEFGFPTHPVDAYRYFAGGGLEVLVGRALPQGALNQLDRETLHKLISRAGKYYATHWDVYTKPYPGVRETLSALQEKGIPLAIVTNKPHVWLLEMLDHFFPDIHFAHVRGAGPDVPTKPNPFTALEAASAIGLPPSAFAFVGDSDVDMLTAHNAGMGAFGAAWGFRGSQELKKAGADFLLDNMSELLNFMQKSK